jgi:hypothetical protein
VHALPTDNVVRKYPQLRSGRPSKAPVDVEIETFVMSVVYGDTLIIERGQVEVF